ncbi:MAG: lipopolysaccharide heptosyltransferase II [Bryobacteraceae bacterium]
MSAPPLPRSASRRNQSARTDRILIRATNWLGDAVMSLPALRAVRRYFPSADISVLALPAVGDLYARESFADRILPLHALRGWRDWGGKRRAAAELRAGAFDKVLLLPNSFESAALVWAAGIPERAGYDRDGRGILLSHAVPRPRPGEIPRHEVYYYLELIRRLGWLDALPGEVSIEMEQSGAMAAAGHEKLAGRGLSGPVIGVCPGAAFGTAKRWLPERFASAGARLQRETGCAIAIFGAAGERDVCQTVAGLIEGEGGSAQSLAGETSLRDFIDMAAACRLFLTNDSGSMHIAAALGTPTVAVFGATDATATGPSGPSATVIYRKVDCSPCLLRECPIDHRCMHAVDAKTVADVALNLLQ